MPRRHTQAGLALSIVVWDMLNRVADAPCRDYTDARKLYPTAGLPEGLSSGELLCLTLYLEGMTRPGIAARLNLPEHTVRHRLERARELVGVKTSEEAARLVLGLELPAEDPEIETLRRTVSQLMERPTRDAYLRLEDAVGNRDDRITELTRQRDTEASKAGHAIQRCLDLEQERDTAIKNGKDSERMYLEMQQRQNGLYQAIVERVESYFDPETESRDLEWDVLPGRLAAKIQSLSDAFYLELGHRQTTELLLEKTKSAYHVQMREQIERAETAEREAAQARREIEHHQNQRRAGWIAAAASVFAAMLVGLGFGGYFGHGGTGR